MYISYIIPRFVVIEAYPTLIDSSCSSSALVALILVHSLERGEAGSTHTSELGTLDNSAIFLYRLLEKKKPRSSGWWQKVIHWMASKSSLFRERRNKADGNSNVYYNYICQQLCYYTIVDQSRVLTGFDIIVVTVCSRNQV